jgi:hypothetical protein
MSDHCSFDLMSAETRYSRSSQINVQSVPCGRLRRKKTQQDHQPAIVEKITDTLTKLDSVRVGVLSRDLEYTRHRSGPAKEDTVVDLISATRILSHFPNSPDVRDQRRLSARKVLAVLNCVAQTTEDMGKVGSAKLSPRTKRRERVKLVSDCQTRSVRDKSSHADSSQHVITYYH